MEFEYLSIGISFVLGAIYLAYLQRFDVHEKEPLGKMALAVILGGIASIVFSTVLYIPFMALTGFQNADWWQMV